MTRTFLLVLVLLSCGITGCDKDATPSTPATAPSATREAERKRLGEINISYWHRLSAIERPIPGTAGSGVRSGGAARTKGEAAARGIEAIGLAEVDADLQSLARENAQVCRQWGQFVNDHYTGSALRMRFLRGAVLPLTGDWSGGVRDDKEIEEGRKALVEEANKLRARAAAVRGMLTQKYGMEFPAIPFVAD